MGNKESYTDPPLNREEESEKLRDATRQGEAELAVRRLRFSTLEQSRAIVAEGRPYTNILMIGESHTGKSSFIRLLLSGVLPVKKPREAVGPYVSSGGDGATTRKLQPYALESGQAAIIYDMIGVDDPYNSKEVICNGVAGYLRPYTEIALGAGAKPPTHWFMFQCVFFQVVAFCVPAVEERLIGKVMTPLPLTTIKNLLKYAKMVATLAELQGSKVLMVVTKMDLMKKLEPSGQAESSKSLNAIRKMLDLESAVDSVFEIQNYPLKSGSGRDYIREQVALEFLHASYDASVNRLRTRVLSKDDWKDL